MLITGSTLNAAGIIVGALIGLGLARQFSAQTQLALRGIMGVFTVMIGLHLTYTGLNGSWFQIFKQIVIMVLALMLGRIIGSGLGIQRNLNRLGQYASKSFAAARPNDPNKLNTGFIVCSLLFCAGPLGPMGAIQEGLNGNCLPLTVKMVMDGLAAMGFVSLFGWGVMLSAIPVYVYQGSITLITLRIQPALNHAQLLDSICTVNGMLVFCVSLIILELKKVHLADYLPSLVVAPLITYLWK